MTVLCMHALNFGCSGYNEKRCQAQQSPPHRWGHPSTSATSETFSSTAKTTSEHFQKFPQFKRNASPIDSTPFSIKSPKLATSFPIQVNYIPHLEAKTYKIFIVPTTRRFNHLTVIVFIALGYDLEDSGTPVKV